ncbi:asparagine synthase (glutamine-hydrolyzing) [Candidatus Pelagibacter sp.]|nr:asparagine synthase (glutamine-hydrolyzing) [Candidatus Pelagibacter sp.]
MCGIAGFIGKKIINRTHLNKTLNLMKNRGPDNQKSLNFRYNENFVYLLHSRLNIIDLNSRSNQPFTIKDFSITYNGEIYNYLELKKNLEQKGYKFVTKSDTEVLLNLYIEYGEKCVNFLEGMWAFAIWNNKEKKLFLSRDKFGEKPIYIHKCDHGFYFGSEIKFISSLKNSKFNINYDKLNIFLQDGYKFLNYDTSTYFLKVFKLEKGTNLTIKNNRIFKKKFFNQKYLINNKLSYQEILENLKIKLFKSIELRLRSDKEIAFCMSGGIDSTALASIARKIFNKKISTFSIIDGDKRYNEFSNIKFMNKYLNARSHSVQLVKKNNLEDLNNLVGYHEAPVSTISYYVHYLMTKKIKDSGFSVSFSGVGSDELFTGYYHHHLLFLNSIKDNFKKHYTEWKKYYWKFIRNPNYRLKQNEFKNSLLIKKIYSQKNDYFRKKTKTNDIYYSKDKLRNVMLNELYHQVVPVILDHDDKNSMFNSIENRSPYLDSDLVNFTNSIPTKHLIKNGYQKNLLREVLSGILPNKIRLDRKKVGFNSSVFSVFDKKIIEESYLQSEKNSFLNSIIDFKKLNYNKLLNSSSYRDSSDKFLYSLITVNSFLKNYE